MFWNTAFPAVRASPDVYGTDTFLDDMLDIAVFIVSIAVLIWLFFGTTCAHVPPVFVQAANSASDDCSNTQATVSDPFNGAVPVLIICHCPSVRL